jgi:protein kinase A
VPSIGSGAASAAGSSTGVGGAAASHAARKDKLKFALKDVTMLTTVGTGTFGRVRVVQYKPTKQYFAMKILKKSEVRAGSCAGVAWQVS